MMSLWDALRMNMMISYQELVRTFPKNHDNMSAVHIAIHHKHYKTVETYYAAINAISQSLSFSADEIKTYL
ncbi:hypothetical protein AAD028_12195 [Escherichia coli]